MTVVSLAIQATLRKFLDAHAAQVQALKQTVCKRLRVFVEITIFFALELIEEMDQPLQLALEKSCRHLTYQKC